MGKSSERLATLGILPELLLWIEKSKNSSSPASTDLRVVLCLFPESGCQEMTSIRCSAVGWKRAPVTSVAGITPLRKKEESNERTSLNCTNLPLSLACAARPDKTGSVSLYVLPLWVLARKIKQYSTFDSVRVICSYFKDPDAVKVPENDQVLCHRVEICIPDTGTRNDRFDSP